MDFSISLVVSQIIHETEKNPAEFRSQNQHVETQRKRGETNTGKITANEEAEVKKPFRRAIDLTPVAGAAGVSRPFRFFVALV